MAAIVTFLFVFRKNGIPVNFLLHTCVFFFSKIQMILSFTLFQYLLPLLSLPQSLPQRDSN